MGEKTTSLGTLPSWNLSAYFSGKNDPRLLDALADAKKRAEEFEKCWRGHITSATSAVDICSALQEYEMIFQEGIKPLHFASLLQSVNSSDPDHGALFQKTQASYTNLYNQIIFFELELLELPEETLQNLAGTNELFNYRHFLLNLLKTKPHRLPEREERMLTDFSLTGNGAFTRLFDEELSQKKFSVTIGEDTEELPEEKVLHMLQNADRDVRKAGAEALTTGLRDDLRRLTYIFNVLGEDKHIRDRYAKFKTPEAARHLANEVTQEAVNIMSAMVSEHTQLVSDYYNLKREVLGLDKLYDYDRYAPVLETEHIYTFEEAREIVLGAYDKFSPRMRERASEFFEKQWIDAETKHGKRGGAFCSYGTPDLHPVVFLNYLGQTKSVLTLAHELGHGVHGSLMRKQTLLNFDTPLTIAETASVFGEMLVFDSLRDGASGKELLALLMGMIEEVFATVFRQHAMYKFEQDFHAARRSEGELKPERISELWIARQREMFGNSVMLSDDYRIWWSYIPHFLHTPFYVYAYTFGELLTLSFYDMYKKTDDKVVFAESYVSMLEAGGTKTPEELVKPFGIDLSKKEFWEGGLRVVGEMVEEAKKLHKEI
ncbi:MAG: hypothetical protein A3J54_02180 [Candidatus Ryanbacteria bacterium RIFCSPHIGHO2_02_FULL_45_13b]|uniref:Oligoendopeptidase n=1 Tax=Candidatus Ryanbacteria bacterium RIFCSPHIGHO2_02_FULL_45_13b TaxID=1802117 RepID=A0A1G2G741_9BACT|nr:MAG: hypothetical protein A3J54_02180 [Candidatus Ryanbacteria bacterium RIFCSPHIGHO2_02_FULL_45_13b]